MGEACLQDDKPTLHRLRPCRLPFMCPTKPSRKIPRKNRVSIGQTVTQMPRAMHEERGDRVYLLSVMLR